MASNNSTSIDGDILTSLGEELKSLGISFNHLHLLKNNRELCIALYRHTDNLKQRFMHEISDSEEQGLFINPGGG
jgi:hypothetical protein